VLPGFLIPYSRVAIPDLFGALEEYFNEELTQQQATLLMNCNSRHSFSLYLKRFSFFISKWISYLSGLLQLESSETGNIKGKWKRFIWLISRLVIGKMVGVSSRVVIIYRFEYLLSLFVGNKMGLGP
jgi:hypothetical protein